MERLGALLGVADRWRWADARLDTSVQHAGLPVLHCFQAALDLCNGVTAHVRAPLEAVMTSLHWRRNSAYANADFLDGYGYCELLGPAGHMRDASVAMGILLLAPCVTYPPHAHPARETYVVIAGRARWRQGDGGWLMRQPGDRIEHAPNEPHAMRTTDEPLLAAYLWHDHLHEGARLTA
jgi:quercetin dioxygenase-like cupin family protein